MKQASTYRDEELRSTTEVKHRTKPCVPHGCARITMHTIPSLEVCQFVAVILYRILVVILFLHPLKSAKQQS